MGAGVPQMKTTRPVWGTEVNRHFYSDGSVRFENDAKMVIAHNSFITFDCGPISRGVFSCKVHIGTDGDSDQHIGVLPADQVESAVSESFCGPGFSAFGGWGCKDGNHEVVEA